MHKGFFITIEGLDGSGKTTLTARLYEYLLSLINEKKINFNNVILTREPGNKNLKICQDIRKIILDHNNLDVKTSVLLFSANRNEHLIKLIKPSLEKNNIVLSDRFVDSSLAYQTYNNNLFDYVLKTNQEIIEDCWPNITFYLDIDYQTSIDRVNKRAENNNHFDFKTEEYFNGIRNNFLKLVERFPNRIKIIDATKTPNEIFNQVKTYIDSCLIK